MQSSDRAMVVQQKTRNRNRTRRRHSMAAGVPLEPIYEHGHSNNDDDPLREYMSQTILTHAQSHHGSNSSSLRLPEFQLVTDNAPTHPEFIVTKRKAVKPMMEDNRWDDSPSKKQPLSSPPPKFRDSPTSTPKKRFTVGNDSNHSINTGSTSSLTISLCDDDDCDDQSVDSFEGGATNNNMTSTEIIDKASDVIAGKYDYNTSPHENFVTKRSSGERRRQGRRSSMPNNSSHHSSTESSSSAVAVDKFGIPIRPPSSNNNGRSRQRRRRSSMPLRASDSVSYDVPPISKPSSSIYDLPQATCGEAVVDKFGIPIPQQPTSSPSTNGRRRRGRRSSMPTTSSFSPSSPPLDKFGIPIRSAMVSESSSSSAHSRSGSTHSRSSTSGRSKRQQRRSSMPSTTRSVSFDLPPPPQPPSRADSSASEPAPESGSVPVDKYGIPIWPKTMGQQQPQQQQRRRRQQRRRSSMPITSTPSDSSDYYGSQSSSTATVDKYGIPINHNNSNGSNSSNNSIPKQQIRPVRRGRRPSMPTYLATNNSTASAMRFSPEELQGPTRIYRNGDNTTTTTSKQDSPLTLNKAPIRPERVPSWDACTMSEQSSKPTFSDSSQQKNASFDVEAKKTNLKKLESLLLSSPSKTDSPSSNKKHPSINVVKGANTSAPVRPQRLPSSNSFGNSSNNSNNNNNDTTATTGKPNSWWDLSESNAEKDVDAAPARRKSSSETSLNSLMQKDGKWWL